MAKARFLYFSPESLEEACRLLVEHGEGARVLAGGTDLLVKIKHGVLRPTAVVSLRRIPGLGEIRFQKGRGLWIGARVTLSEVAFHPRILRHYPAVAYAASVTGNVQVRNMGTVAGNLCNAAPSAENAPVLMARGARLLLLGPEGSREMSLESFFLGPGRTDLRPGEILTQIRVPAPPGGSGASYQHISPRGKVDISAVGVGAYLVMDGPVCQTVRIVLGAVAPTPIRARRAEVFLNGRELDPEAAEEAGRLAAEEARPITDMRATAEYRRRMVAVLTKRALLHAARRGSGPRRGVHPARGRRNAERGDE